jgi:hypothetical protein
LDQCYTVAGIADIVSDKQTKWAWDAEAVSYKPQSQYVVYMFKAKSDAACRVS